MIHIGIVIWLFWPDHAALLLASFTSFRMHTKPKKLKVHYVAFEKKLWKVHIHNIDKLIIQTQKYLIFPYLN